MNLWKRIFRRRDEMPASNLPQPLPPRAPGERTGEAESVPAIVGSVSRNEREGELRLANYEEDEPFAFVSYSRQDKEVVFEVLARLHDEGYRLWFDVEGIKAAEEWERKIHEQMKNPNCVSILLFLSPAALESPYVQDEVRIGKFLEKSFVPVLLNQVHAEGLGGNFAFLQKLNCILPEPAQLDRVVTRIIDGLGEDTRRSSYQVDGELLGLGYLATVEDLLHPGETSDSQKREEKQRKRQKDLIRGMRQRGDAEYVIDNVFQLTSEATGAMQSLERLPAGGAAPDRPHNLVTRPLTIRQAFVAPLRLVTGLITRLDENWPPLVASYGALVEQDRTNKLDDLHFYMEFCWLAWGPSVSTLPDTPGEGGATFMVLQAAYGDEANSLPLILKQEQWSALPESLDKLRSNGCPVCLTKAILVKPAIDEFFSELRQHALFKDMVAENAQGFVALYLPFHDEGFENGGIEAITRVQEAFYSTAYVWLMIEQVPPPGDPRHRLRPQAAMKPGFVIPFFEHANLATSKCLDFLQHCLARKAIYHVIECERDRDYRDAGYYRFATALFPRRMVELLKEEIARLPERERQIVDQRFIIPEHPAEWRRHEEVVAFANDVAETIKEKLGESHEMKPADFIEVLALDEREESLRLLREFYGGLYTAEFPDENERELLGNMEKYLQLRSDGWYGRNNYHILLLRDKFTGKIAGGCVADYLERCNVGVIEFVVVDPALRGRGLGKRLLDEVTLSFESDARKAGREDLAGICGEVNDPYRACDLNEHLDGFARLRMWARFGFALMDFPYVQPALSSGQQAVLGLGLMFQPRDFQLRSQLPSALVEQIVADFQIWAMRIPEPDREAEFQQMRDWLRGRENVILLDMCEYGCDEQTPPFCVDEIAGSGHPLLEPFRRLYAQEFSNGRTAESPSGFCGSRVVLEGPVPHFYWMWGILPKRGEPLAGLASFFGLPHCGFGGYFALSQPLRGKGNLRRLIRMVERQLVSANPLTRGWYVECERSSEELSIFLRCGFAEVPIEYVQPRLVTDLTGISDGYRLALLYKSLGRVYAQPVLSGAELKRDLEEVFNAVYQLDDDQTLAACLDRISIPCKDGENVFASRGLTSPDPA